MFWVVAAWLGLPGDFHWWWTVAFPILGATVIDAILIFVREAPLWELISAFIIVCITLFTIAPWLRKKWASATSTSGSTAPTYSIENVYVGSQNEGKGEPETQKRWRGQATLDRYLDLMQLWLDDRDKPLAALTYDDARRTLARTRTLQILKRLNPNGKRDVLQFLHEHKLISADDPVIRLNTADLSSANLARMDLTDANLSGANLRGADLSDAVCNQTARHGLTAKRARERGAPSWVFNRFGLCANLSHANLSDAVLKRARLGGCKLLAANFAGADLEEADLREADLQMARNLKQEQIEQAYGTHQQDEFLPNTLLPEGLGPPPAWSKLAHEQRRERNNL
jgi:hypothetical protein